MPSKNDAGKEELLDIFSKFKINHLENPVEPKEYVVEPKSYVYLPEEWRIPKYLSLYNGIGWIEKWVSTRHSLNNFFDTIAFVSQIEPKNVCDAL